MKEKKNISIVTTNYDILFEEAAKYEKIDYTDGFSKSENRNNLKFDIQNFNEDKINIIKVHGSLTWRRYYSDIYKDKIENIKNPVMIFPSVNKYSQSYEKPYFELFDKFRELLTKKNTFLITNGFSFLDNHIAKMIIEKIKENKNLTVLITDYNINQEHNNWNEMKKLMEKGYNVSFLKATMNDDLIYYLEGDIGEKI